MVSIFLRLQYILVFLFSLGIHSPVYSVFKNIHTPYNICEGELKDGYFLVTGVFSSLDNAEVFTKELQSKGYDAQYAFSSGKKLYYCYIKHTQSLEEVKGAYFELKKNKEFPDAWILRVHNKNESKVAALAITQPEEKNEAEAIGKKELKPSAPHHDKSHTHNSYNVFVNVMDSQNRQVVATILVVGGKDRVIARIKPGQIFFLKIPKTESQTVLLTSEVFGYHKTEVGLPLGDKIALNAMKNVKVSGENVTVDFVLENCQKGDLMVMPNVFFHSNSNIMRMKSEEDLQTLLAIMKENPSLKIAVHGHTNGNSSGPITKITDSCDNFFNPSEKEETRGSSMKLSLLRAEAVKMYLLKNGIEVDRITIQGWGGKKMLYKENSPRYQQNVRVEIEVLEIG